MFAFEWLPPLPEPLDNLLDGVLLAILVSPVLYVFLFRPLIRHITALQHVQKLLQHQRDHLGEEVQRRMAQVVERNQEIVESESRFRGLVEQSLAGIYILQDGRFVYVNPHMAEIFGYPATNELIGIKLLSLVVDRDRNTVADKISGPFETGVKDASYSFTAIRKNGCPIDIGAHGALATHNGRPAIIGLMQDVTAKKSDEERIQQYVVQLEHSFISSIEVVTAMVELRDPYTDGHEKRVGKIAVAIGTELGLDPHHIEGLLIGGYIHDIGKLIVPAEILAKPSKLSEVEYELIKGHAQAGYDILKKGNFPWPVAEIAHQHHERVDGSGYPQGLKGDAILFEARIIAVADVVEAMSMHRPYRPSVGLNNALKEIERGRGTLYDAQISDACLKLFREKNYVLPSQLD